MLPRRRLPKKTRTPDGGDLRGGSGSGPGGGAVIRHSWRRPTWSLPGRTGQDSGCRGRAGGGGDGGDAGGDLVGGGSCY